MGVAQGQRTHSALGEVPVASSDEDNSLDEPNTTRVRQIALRLIGIVTKDESVCATLLSSVMRVMKENDTDYLSSKELEAFIHTVTVDVCRNVVCQRINTIAPQIMVGAMGEDVANDLLGSKVLASVHITVWDELRRIARREDDECNRLLSSPLFADTNHTDRNRDDFESLVRRATLDATWNETYELMWISAWNIVSRRLEGVQPADVDDVMQEVITVVLRAMVKQKIHKSLWFYLGRVAGNKSAEFFRNRKRALVSLGVLDDSQHPFIADDEQAANESRELIRKKRRSNVYAVLRSLPCAQKQVVVLRAKGMTYDEIAEKTGRTVGSIHGLLFRARHNAQELLSRLRTEEE